MTSLNKIAAAVGISLLATLCVVLLAAVLVLALDFVLLLFLGILFSVFLTKTSEKAGKILPVGYAWQLASVTGILIVVTLIGTGLLGNQIYERVEQTSSKLDESAEELASRLEEYPWALQAFKKIPFANRLVAEGSQASDHHSSGKSGNSEALTSSSGRGASTQNASPRPSKNQAPSPSSEFLQSAAGKVFSALKQIFETSLGLVANIGVIFFVGIFIAAKPLMYRDGLASLFPIDRRERVSEILNEMSDALFGWLTGRFMTMIITGSGTAAALMLLGVPMALTVGVITGLLTFIPNIGAIIALALAILMALPQGMTIVTWVVALYGVLQLLESNIIAPLLQQRQASIPPALLISSQLVMGAIAGFLGIMVAPPLLAGLLVLVKEAWIKDVLGDSS